MKKVLPTTTRAVAQYIAQGGKKKGKKSRRKNGENHGVANK